MPDNNAKTISGALIVVLCFVIGCLFLYWAVEYWVYNTFDRDRYEISKIQPAGGGDSWSFWKIDHRTGAVEYCSLSPSAKKSDFTCVAAKSETTVAPMVKADDTATNTSPTNMSSTPAEPKN